GYFNWVHLDDAASATILALEQQAKGVFNIVDDKPAQVREWLADPPAAAGGVLNRGAGEPAQVRECLPYLAESAGVRRPIRLPKWMAQLLAGEMVKMVTEGRAFSNAKAKRELGGGVGHPAGRRGFK